MDDEEDSSWFFEVCCIGLAGFIVLLIFGFFLEIAWLIWNWFADFF